MNKKSAMLVLVILIAMTLASISAAKRFSPVPGVQHTQVNQAQGTSTVASSPEDRRSLKEKAKEAGNFVGSQNPKRVAEFANLAELTAGSSTVIIGTPTKNTSTLSRDGRKLTLNYEVQVEYVYKGKLQEGSTITVALPGGRLKFDDGSTAEIKTQWLRKMQNSKTYALFLTPENELFVTTGEGQGIFEIPTTEHDRTVKSHSGIAKDPVWKYHGMPVKDFLKELRQATKLAPRS